MGHFLFFVLHVIAILFFPMALFVTIPAHLIYGVVGSKREPVPTYDTHVTCPDCKELVLREASVCKHCGCKLVPMPLPRVFSRDWFADHAGILTARFFKENK